MAFLHCHKCGWSQDDFWSLDGYNPFRSDLIDHLKDSLFKDKIHVDNSLIEEMGIKNNFGYDPEEKRSWVNGKEYVVASLKRKIRNIENMAVKTSNEWKEVKDSFLCPKCGSKSDWDID